MTEPSAFFIRAFGEEPRVRVLDEDRELLAAVPRGNQLEARSRAVAPMLRLERGRWDARMPGDCDREAWLGLLVIDGLLVHSVVVASEPRSEVVGPGDVLRPWQHDEEVPTVPFASQWQVIQPARVAVLDQRFTALACRWPSLVRSIVARAVRRSHWLTLQLAIADERRVDDRLILFFWHLADRWGRVGPDGVLVPLPVTHDVLAQLVCAQRPTVTSALKRLTDAGRISRRPDRTWLLAPVPPESPMAVRSSSQNAAA